MIFTLLAVLGTLLMYICYHNERRAHSRTREQLAQFAAQGGSPAFISLEAQQPIPAFATLSQAELQEVYQLLHRAQRLPTTEPAERRAAGKLMRLIEEESRAREAREGRCER